jgi:hypothetical protein
MPAHPALVLRRGRGRSRRRESGGRKLAAPDSLSILPVAQTVPIAPAHVRSAPASPIPASIEAPSTGPDECPLEGRRILAVSATVGVRSVRSVS